MMYAPTTIPAITDIVLAAATEGRPLEIRGGGTKSGLGRAVQVADTLDMRGLSGITLYEPAEMVISALAGTPLSVVEATLAEKGQMLPFEPPRLLEVLGGEGEPTIGGIVATGLSGPRRITAGACRDSLIGVKFINGRGELITSGGRVMKNVTGYDFAKLQAGAYGTLGVLTEVTFKVLPRPAATATLVWDGLTDKAAVSLLCAAMGTPFEVSGAAHRPAREGRPAATCLRLENVPESIAYRTDALIEALEAHGRPRLVMGEESLALWADITEARDVATVEGAAVWRLSTAPKSAPGVVGAIRERMETVALYDWSGGLVWLAVPPGIDAGASVIRPAVSAAGGHATLVRVPDTLRGAVEPFHPPSEGVARISRGLKQVFDPAGVLNPGRMHAGA